MKLFIFFNNFEARLRKRYHVIMTNQEAHSKASRKSKMELFGKIVNYQSL